MNLPGVDGIMLRGDGMFLDNPGPRGNEHRDREYHRRWNMRDFTLVQTVGMSTLTPFYMIDWFRNGDFWQGIFSEVRDTNPE